MTPRRMLAKRNAALKTARESWLQEWRALAEHLQPHRTQFLVTSGDANRGPEWNRQIVNATQLRAVRVLSSGMMSGVTSPARPWFRFSVPDPDLAEVPHVREWLHICEERVRDIFARSNIYNALFSAYVDLVVWGTSALLLEDDHQDVVRAYHFPIGSYCLATSPRQQVDTVYRELLLSVRQLVEKFTLFRCSDQVRRWYREGEFDKPVKVLHVIQPNGSYSPNRLDLGPDGKRWKSCWMEMDRDDRVGFLHEGGYHEFPVLAPRWEVNGEEVYGRSPGMLALGECRALQIQELRKAQILDTITQPPMNAPAALIGRGVANLANGVNYYDGPGKIEPSVVIDPRAMGEVREGTAEHERRINELLLADLWLMMAGRDKNMTAEEVRARQDEQMLQLGPVMERLQDELLDPACTRVFNAAYRRGLLPPPPEELLGQPFKIEYLSILSRAQKLVAVNAAERLIQIVGVIAAIPGCEDVVDNLNRDGVVALAGDALGAPPTMVNDAETVAQTRRVRGEQAALQQRGQAMAEAAKAARDAAGASLDGDTMLRRFIESGALSGDARGAA